MGKEATTNSIATVEPRHEQSRAVSKYDPSLSNVDIGALFEEAVKQGSAMEVIKELRAMESEMHARTAKTRFDTAMSQFQSECPVLIKEKGVPDRSGKIAYRYCPLESIEVQIRPLLRKHGFSHTFDTDTNSADGWVIAKCVVKHEGGHFETSTAKFPLGTKTPIQSDTQQFAAALTFANRRALQNAYGLVIAGDDLDGATGKIKPFGPSTKAAEPNVRALATELWKLLPPQVAGKNTSWELAKQFLVDEGFITPEEHGGNVHAPQFSPERFSEVIAAIKTKAGA